MSKLTDALRGTKNHAEAEQVLADANPTAADLKAAAKELHVNPNGNKNQVAARILGVTGGSRSNFNTVSGKHH
jgi:hypothetical protein